MVRTGSHSPNEAENSLVEDIQYTPLSQYRFSLTACVHSETEKLQYATNATNITHLALSCSKSYFQNHHLIDK